MWSSVAAAVLLLGGVAAEIGFRPASGGQTAPTEPLASLQTRTAAGPQQTSSTPTPPKSEPQQPKTGATLQGRTSLVRSVANSPGGETPAKGGADKTIKRWDAAADRNAAALVGLGDSANISAVAFRPDGKTPASGSADKTIKPWDAATAGSAASTPPVVSPPAGPPPPPRDEASMKEDYTVPTLGMEMKLIKPGAFTMGSPKDEEGRFDNEGPQHEVKITKAFYMGVCPVTVGQFRAFVQDSGYQTDAEKDGNGGFGFSTMTGKWEQKPEYTWRHPGFSQEDDHPVVEMSWHDATAFCAWLSKREGKTYGLPTEAEWEYACRAGTTTRFWCGDANAGLHHRVNIADASLRGNVDIEAAKNPTFVPWDDGYAFTSPVGHFKANPWGLYDMGGNVWQWCADWYDPYQEGHNKDPKGPDGGNGRVLRGCSWLNEPRDCRSAHRLGYDPANRDDNLGFRVVLRLSGRTP